MKAIFVHLSDIHFGQEKNGGDVAVNNDAKRRLIDDARAEVAKLGGKASGVIVTGDIAYSGKEREYRTAAGWLGELTDAIGCERVNVQMVPGNHDIDRDKISVPIECVLAQIRENGDAVLDPLLDSAEGCDFLYGRFEAYRDFALDYECELDINGQMSSGGRLELAKGRSIKFVRLNSALICSRKDDEGKLILGKRQQVLPEEDGEEIIVLVHHPLYRSMFSSQIARARRPLMAFVMVLSWSRQIWSAGSPAPPYPSPVHHLRPLHGAKRIKASFPRAVARTFRSLFHSGTGHSLHDGEALLVGQFCH